MSTLYKYEAEKYLEIVIEHKDINKGKYEFINEEAGKKSHFIGIKVHGYKFGFSVSDKKYNTDGTEHRIKGKRGIVVITIPKKDKTKKGESNVSSGKGTTKDNSGHDSEGGKS